MTEFVGLDMEMCFHENYHEVLEVLEELFLSIFDGLNAKCRYTSVYLSVYLSVHLYCIYDSN